MFYAQNCSQVVKNTKIENVIFIVASVNVNLILAHQYFLFVSVV